MDNKHIGNTTEASMEGLLNNCSQLNVFHATNNSYFTEKNFEDFVKFTNIENYSLYHDQSSDSEYSASIPSMYIDSKNVKQEDVKCELAFASYEKDVNVSESNLQEFTNTKLVEDKIVSMQTSFSSTKFPIMKLLKPKSRPHICLECCFKCNNVFRVLDSPSHIIRIRSIDKKKEFFKIEPSLCDDSCLCDLCWKDLEKTYKSIKSNNRKKETYSEKKSRLLERYAKKNVSKNRNQARRCSIHLCSRSYCQKMTVNEYENIKKLFLTVESCHLVFVQSTKQTKDFLKFPLRLCKIHRDMILVMSTCQICGDKLNPPFNTDDWSMYEIWNFVLIENHLPLILKPPMFICVTCKGYISKTNPGFPTTDLPCLQEYILKSNSIRLKLYGELQYDLLNICQGSTNLESPIVFPITENKKNCVRLTKVKFSDPLITIINNYEIGCYKNDAKSITSTSILLNKAEPNLCTPKLEIKDEGLYKVEPEDEYSKTYYDNSLQNLCQVDNVEKVENELEVMIISSCQAVSEHNEIENNQSKLNSHAICSVAQNRSSIYYLKECNQNQSIYEINTIPKTVYLDDTNNSMNSFIAAVEPPDAILNSVVIKRKQSNVICDTISNKHVKKQRKNEKYSFNEKKFTDDNTTIFYKNKNIAHSSINLQSTLKMTYNYKNKYDYNSDISNSKMFSETNSEEIIPDCGKEKTDYIIGASYDDLSLDYHCELIKSKFETKPAYEIEMDKNDTKLITSTSLLLNKAEPNLCTPKLEIKDEGLYIVEPEEEYFKTYDN